MEHVDVVHVKQGVLARFAVGCEPLEIPSPIAPPPTPTRRIWVTYGFEVIHEVEVAYQVKDPYEVEITNVGE